MDERELDEWQKEVRGAQGAPSGGPPAPSPAPDETLEDGLLLGRIALEWELLRPEHLETALREQREEQERGRRAELGRILVERRWLKVEDLARVLAEQRRRLEGVPDLPRYEIRERVGEGATAVVYRGWDRELQRPVALKVQRERAGLSPVARERFHREARAAAGLAHPNLVTVYDAGEQDGRLYLVMELVEGRPLSDLLREGRTPQEDLVRLLEKVARGVASAHAKGIVHRDLKPANVLVTVSNEPKVADFGLAHLAAEGAQLTRTGATLGTPLYMAPEQAGGRTHDISPRTDVYALGVMLYEAATGAMPHVGESLMEIYGKILREEPRRPRELNPRLSRDLETIIAKALERDPQRRYADAGALAEDLRRCLAGEPILARPISLAERAWRKARKYRAILLPAAGAAALTATLLTVVLTQAARGRERIRTTLAAAEEEERRGRPADARDRYRSLLVLDPENRPARSGLERVEARIRSDEEGLAARLKAQEETLRRLREKEVNPVPRQGLRVHLALDDHGGQVAADSSGNGTHGSLPHDPIWVDGKIGGALRFDGRRAFVSLPELDLGDSFTISLWVNLSEDASDINTLLANTGGGAGVHGFKLFINSFQTRDRKILFETGNGVDGCTTATEPGTFGAGEWRHVAVVAARAQRTARIFLDGKNVTAAAEVAGNFKSTGPIDIGRMFHGGFYLRGTLDDIRIYTRALSPPEIDELAGGTR